MSNNICNRFGLLEVEKQKASQDYPVLSYSHIPLELFKLMVETFPKFKLHHCTIESSSLTDQIKLGDYQELSNCYLVNIPLKISGRRKNVTNCYLS